MKVIRIDSPLGSSPIKASVMTDSAVRPHRRPLFLPPGSWECEIRPAVRIDRLGKAIAAKFAPRYYSEFALVNYLRPADGSADPLADMTDDAVVTGDWRPMAEMAAHAAFSQPEFDSLVEALSLNTTFKTGDIIILPAVLKSFSPAINQEINFDNILQFRIK